MFVYKDLRMVVLLVWSRYVQVFPECKAFDADGLNILSISPTLPSTRCGLHPGFVRLIVDVDISDTNFHKTILQKIGNSF